MSLLQRLFAPQTAQSLHTQVLRKDLKQDDVNKTTKASDSDEQEGMLDVEKLLQRLIDEDEFRTDTASEKRKETLDVAEERGRRDGEAEEAEEEEEEMHTNDSDNNGNRRDNIEETITQMKDETKQDGEKDQQQGKAKRNATPDKMKEKDKKEENDNLFSRDSVTEDEKNKDRDNEEDNEENNNKRKTEKDSKGGFTLNHADDSLSLTVALENLYRRYQRATLRYETIERAKMSAIDREIARCAQELHGKTVQLQTEMAAVEKRVSNTENPTYRLNEAHEQFDYIDSVVGNNREYAKLLKARSVAEYLRFQSLLEQLAAYLQESSAGRRGTLESAVATAIGMVQLPERDESDTRQALEFRETLQTHIDRVNETEATYQRQNRRLLQQKHRCSYYFDDKPVYEFIEQTVRDALEKDDTQVDPVRLSEIIQTLKQYVDLRQVIRDGRYELDVASADVERKTATRDFLFFVRQAQLRTLRQVEREMRLSGDKRLDELVHLADIDRSVIDETVDELTASRRCVERAMKNYLNETKKQVVAARERFNSTKQTYLETLDDLEKFSAEVRSRSLWPTFIDVDELERAIQTTVCEQGNNDAKQLYDSAEPIQFQQPTEKFMDTLDYLLLTLLLPDTDNQNNEEKPQENVQDIDSVVRFTPDAVLTFSKRFYQPQNGSTASVNIASDNLLSFQTSQAYSSLRKIAKSNRLPDVALLVSYLSTLNRKQTQSLLYYLLQKKRMAPAGELKILEARVNLLKKAELKRMELVNAWFVSTKNKPKPSIN